MPENDTSSEVLDNGTLVEPTNENSIVDSVDNVTSFDFLIKEEPSEHYELLILIAGTIADEPAAIIVGHVKNLLEEMGAAITKHEILSRRNLGYTVAKSRTGIYGLFEFDLLKKQLPVVQEKMRLRKDVVRFLIIKKSVLALEEIAENERIAQKITARRLAKKIAHDASVVAAEKETAKEKTTQSSMSESAAIPDVAKEQIKDKPKDRPKKTLEDIDKEIDRILGGDIEL